MANNWQIDMIAGLDPNQSRAKINGQINKLKGQLKDISLTAKIDPKIASDIQKQLTNLQVSLTNVKISDKALNDMVSQINNALQGIKIPNINIGGSNGGNILGNNVAKLEEFRKSLSNIGMSSTDIDTVAQRIENLGVKINSLNQSLSHTSGAKGDRNLLNIEVGGIDEFGQAVKLTQTWDMDLGQLVKDVDAVSSATKRAGTSTNVFAKQQSQAVANLTNQINQLNRAANDQNAARPISDSSHLSSLSTAYNDIISAIQRMGNASSDTFITEQNNVKTLISDYKSLVSEFRNAENVSTKMKGTDLTSGLSIAKNDLEKFKADAKDFPQITQTIKDLDTAIANVGDASSLNSFNDQLRVARSELAKIKSETNASNRNEKVGINISGLQSKIADLQKISPEIDKFETEINGAKVSVQSLLSDLSKISTQSDFSVVSAKFNAFTKAAEASGIAIRDFGNVTDSIAKKANEIQLSYANGDYNAKVESTIAKTQQWVNANGEARISTTSLSTALSNLDKAYLAITADGGNTVANQKALKQAESELSAEIKKVTNDVTSMNATMAKSSAVDALRQKYQMFYDTNTAAHRKWGKSLLSAINELAPGAEVSKQRIKELEQGFINTANAARQAGKLGLSFFDTIKQGMSKFSYWTSSTFIIMKTVQEFKQMISNVEELDDALTNISYTMDVSNSQLEKIGNSALQTAKDLNTSASNVLDAVKTYANANETAESILNKAKPTIMMSNVTGMGTEQTVDIIQGTVEQFDLEDTEEQLMHISDVLQTVSMSMPYDFAKGVNELSEGIQASGSVAKDAGYDLENYTALLGTLIAKTRQSGSELGRSLRTMFVRTTKASSSALANGEVTEDDLSNAEKALRRVGIEVRSDIDTFKSFDEIMGELYNKVDSLSEVDLSNIAYEVASTRQTNVFKMMIKAYGDYQNMAEKAYDSDGATLANQEKYAESLKGKITELGTIWEKIGDDAVSSSWLKGLTDVGIGVSSLVEKFGLLKTAIVGIGAYAGFKNVGVAQLY